ncbi:ATP-binding protein [Reichenbachiella agarivorans]|uniref:ATP-binding protein n=1 Tax=Reichenbachiella agarivorans TaxID=2979464 RepID=A0ABY6CM17_9BACT|nr:7TM diverse intracellular signaling domain-containing protein [Reichenbachiella agarivorans]UXP31546.1 ATP-binding protein [Reichenbachiella agarivorans]
MLLYLFCFALLGREQQESVIFKTSIFEDSLGKETLASVQSQPFIPRQNSDLIFGVTRSCYWVKLDLIQFPKQFVVEIDRALLDSLSVYYFNTDQQLVSHHFGFEVNAHGQPNAFTIPYALIDADEIKDSVIYIRAKSTYAMMLPMNIQSIPSFYASRQLNDIFAILLVGGLFVMMLYNFILWTSVKDFTYLVYSMGILITVIVQIGIQGYAYQFIPQSTVVSYYIVSVSIAINIIIAAYFCLEFLGRQNLSKWMKYGLYALVGLGLTILFCESIGLKYLAKDIIVLTTSLGSVLVLCISTVLMIKRVPLAKYFQIAWTIYLMGIIIYSLRSEGYIENNFFTANFAFIGKFIDVCLMSFALGYKYNTVKRENDELQNQLTKELEMLVERRTLALNQTLQEKEILLKEIHHRVKNNLQVISSLLNIQSRNTQNQEAKDAMRGGQSRIKSMALIHQKLYTSDNLSEIKMDEYTIQLCNHLFRTYEPGDHIHNRIEMNQICLDLESTIPIGLIITELVMNSYKYAFKGKSSGEVLIQLNRINDKILELVIADDGIGMPSFDIQQIESLGLSLVHTLVEQMDGELDIRHDHGTHFRIIFDPKIVQA